MHYDSTRTVCPFYADETLKKVSCEGIGCNRLTLTFDSAADKHDYKCKLCDTDYKRCEIYRLIAKKYEEVTENGKVED